MAEDEMFLENLEEYVCDENEVVTYKWLSTTLGLHVNRAKQMLFTFVDQQRNKRENDSLSVIYFVSGTRKRENGEVVHQCCVVPEEKLDSFKSTLSTTTSCHIYSVQKARLKDSNALYITDYEKRKDNLTEYHKHSAIQCPSAKVRSEEEIAKLRGRTPKETQNEATEKAASKLVNGHGKMEGAKAKPAQKSGIAGMFASASKKTEKKQIPPASKTQEKVEMKDKGGKSTAQSSARPKGGMMSFFSKQTDVKTEPSEKSEDESEGQKNKPEPSKSTDTCTKTTKTDTKKKESPPSLSNSNKGKGKKSRRKEESDDEPQQKKRRRIREDLFESSSEEEDTEMESESPVPSPPPRELTPPREPTPEPESPIPDNKDSKSNSDKPMSGEKRRKRKRKLVPKTFMDEDGFMVTEKVWESDSTDASEVEESPKEPPKTKVKQTTEKTGQKKPSPEKKVSPNKGSSKQASLMSFFKKK